MNIDNLLFDEKKEIYIYGAGKKGRELLELLKKANVNVKNFMVTDMKNNAIEIEDIAIVAVSRPMTDDYIVLIATSEKFRSEIEMKLQNEGIDNYIYVDEELLKALRRKAFEVDPNAFLVRTEPVSNVFGIDRGTPIDRYYIESFLDSFVDRCSEGIQYKILEVGEDTYSKRLTARLGDEGSVNDILDYSKGMDLTDFSTLREGYYDLFVCTQTFNFIYQLDKAVKGANYVLRKGGTLLATVAGTITPISRYDMDRWGHYWGFTDLSAKRIFSDSFGEENVEVKVYGNSIAATAFVQGCAVEDLPDLHLLDDTDLDYQILLGILARKR